MYGPETTDLVVKYYDEAFGISGEAEVAWYLNQARSFGSPVLDLACGTGRLAILLAREGFEVTAFDQSEGMLNRFRNKLRFEPPSVVGRICIDNQPMSHFAFPHRYNTILCCDAFFHNLSVEEQMSCLGCVARHLTPEGRFFFNLPNPTSDFILTSARSTGSVFEERGCYPLIDGSGVLRVEQAQAGNLLDQTITTTLRIKKLDRQDNVVEQGESFWVTRYLFRYEAVHLLYRCGFEVESLVGDYQNGPVTEKGQLIFQAKLGDRSAG